jgi:hypothetical protein
LAATYPRSRRMTATSAPPSRSLQLRSGAAGQARTHGLGSMAQPGGAKLRPASRAKRSLLLELSWRYLDKTDHGDAPQSDASGSERSGHARALGQPSRPPSVSGYPITTNVHSALGCAAPCSRRVRLRRSADPTQHAKRPTGRAELRRCHPRRRLAGGDLHVGLGKADHGCGGVGEVDGQQVCS